MELIYSRHDLATFARLPPLSPALGRLLIPKQVPSRAQIAGAVGKVVRNPVKAVKDGLARDAAAMNVAKASGMTRGGLVKSGAVQLYKNRGEIAKAVGRGVKSGVVSLAKQKDLIVNTGGAIGSGIGGSMGGLPGKLAGDNLGAMVTRRAYDDIAAVGKGVRAAKQAAGNRVAKIKAGVKATLQEGRKNFAGKKKDYFDDQVGWAIGNTVAEASPFRIPLQGGAVAIRTVPSVSKGIIKIAKGAPIKQTIKETGQEILDKNNVPKMIKRGNARERLVRRKINRKLGELRGDYSRHLGRYVSFSRRFWRRKKPFFRY